MQNLAEIREMIVKRAADLLPLFDQFASLLKLVNSTQEGVKNSARLMGAVVWTQLVRELDARGLKPISSRINAARATAYTPAPPKVAAKASPAQAPALAQATSPQKTKKPKPELSRSGVRHSSQHPPVQARVRVA